MEMHQIRYFLAVCETHNFTRAAEKCHVAQPSLTRAIQSLEDELGGLLFHRERNQTRLTDLGQLMRPHLEEVLKESEAAKSTAKGFLRAENAPLNVGVMCTIGPLRIVGCLAKFHQDHPGIEVSLVERVPHELADLLMSGKLDVAVMAQPEPFHERFNVLPLYEERFMVAFPPGHRFESQKAVRVADMDGESYLSRLHCEYDGAFGDLWAAHGVKCSIAFSSMREDWIQTMVMAGMGICLIPEFSPVLPGTPMRPVVEPEVARRVSLVTVSGRRHSPAVAAFVRAIKAYRWPSQRPALAA